MAFDRRTFIKGTSVAGLTLMAPGIIGRAKADDKIRLASILDQSGGLDIYGKPMANATQMAVDEINAAGGLNGQQIELINYDPQSNIQFYTQYATKAATGDKAHVVHAGITSASGSKLAANTSPGSSRVTRRNRSRRTSSALRA